MIGARMRLLALPVAAAVLTCCAALTTEEREAAFECSMRSSGWIIVDGMLVYYRSNASFPVCPTQDDPHPNTPALLLLHGWNGCSYDYQAVLDQLPREMRAVAPDLPGCGISEKREIPYGMDFYVEFVGKLADALRIRKLILVGHSLGGQIAIHYAYRHPERVERLVLIDPYGLSGEEESLVWLRRQGLLVDLFSRLDYNPAVSLVLGLKVFHDPKYATRPVADPMVCSTVSPEGIDAQRKIIRDVLGHQPVDAILPSLSLPVLVIWGREDRVLQPKWADRFATKIPNARLEVLPECGHVPHVEQSSRVASLIADFARTAPGDPVPSHSDR